MRRLLTIRYATTAIFLFLIIGPVGIALDEPEVQPTAAPTRGAQELTGGKKTPTPVASPSPVPIGQRPDLTNPVIKSQAGVTAQIQAAPRQLMNPGYIPALQAQAYQAIGANQQVDEAYKRGEITKDSYDKFQAARAAQLLAASATTNAALDNLKSPSSSRSNSLKGVAVPMPSPSTDSFYSRSVQVTTTPGQDIATTTQAPDRAPVAESSGVGIVDKNKPGKDPGGLFFLESAKPVDTSGVRVVNDNQAVIKNKPEDDLDPKSPSGFNAPILITSEHSEVLAKDEGTTRSTDGSKRALQAGDPYFPSGSVGSINQAYQNPSLQEKTSSLPKGDLSLRNRLLARKAALAKNSQSSAKNSSGTSGADSTLDPAAGAKPGLSKAETKPVAIQNDEGEPKDKLSRSISGFVKAIKESIIRKNLPPEKERSLASVNAGGANPEDDSIHWFSLILKLAGLMAFGYFIGFVLLGKRSSRAK